MKRNRFERGQALVLIILAIVAIFGFAALSVDIGRVFAERRRAQNAADAAAMAAAYFGANYIVATPGATDAQIEAVAIEKAMAQLLLNDYSDAHPNLDDGTKIEIEVHYPPVAPSVYAGQAGYYQVIIHEEVDKVFSQFVYQGPLKFTVEAVSNSSSSQGMFGGNAIVATSPTSCKALWFAGTGDTRIKGGNAYSLSYAGRGADGSCTPGSVTGANSCASGVRDGSGLITLDNGHSIDTTGPWRDTNSHDGVVYVATPPATPAPAPVNECAAVQPVDLLPEPPCGANAAPPTLSADGRTKIYSPGTYPNGIKITGSGDKIHLNPGLYCLDSDISMIGGSITGNGVMFYMRGGSFNLGGSTIVTLQAITDLHGTADGKQPDFQWGGMLIYMPYANQGEVHIGGGSSSFYAGTIFAPGPRQTEGQDKCVIEGSGTTIGLAASVICYTVKITGSASVNINYDPKYNFQFPADLNLSQ